MRRLVAIFSTLALVASLTVSSVAAAPGGQADSLVGSLSLVPTAASASATSAWQAKIGAGGANGTAKLQILDTGTGSLTLKLVKMRPATLLPVVLHEGTCSAVGAILARLDPIRSSNTGAAARTSSLTITRARAVSAALRSGGKVAIQIGSGSAVRCGLFAALAVPPPVGVGSNYSDEPGKSAFAAMINYCASRTSVSPKVNTVAHDAFQNGIDAYLRGTPADIFTWSAGGRMRFLADQGLATPISDVWAKIGDHYTDAVKAASTASDGKQYFIPIYQYPWVVIYRKSLFAEKGYTVPKTLDEFIALADKMKADGLVPLAFADKDGWPAMGTFDILDMRQNGYQFHVDLLAGKEKWTDPRVKDVFNLWKRLLPYSQPDALSRTWQEGARSLIAKEAGMYFLGTFAADQTTDPAVRSDLDMFTFPVLGNKWDAEKAVDAPIDGLMLSNSPRNLAGARTILACVATGAAQLTFIKSSPTGVAAARDADTSGYTPFQKKMATIIGGSGAIAQFLDRDTRPDFAGLSGMQSFLKGFLADPNQDLTAYLARIQAFYDSLPPPTNP